MSKILGLKTGPSGEGNDFAFAGRKTCSAFALL